MALLRYSKTKSSIPTAKDTGLGETTTKDANTAVQRVLTEQSQCTGAPQTQSGTCKRKLYTSFKSLNMA